MAWLHVRTDVGKSIRPADVAAFVLIVALIGLAWYEQATRRAEVNDVIANIGGRIYRNTTDDVYAIAINDKRSIADELFEKLPRLGNLESISLSRSQFSGDRLAYLTELRSLRSLSLLDTNVENSDLAHVGGCRHLEVLSLDGTRISSRGISQLSELNELKCLTLSRTEIDDDCIEALSQLTSLRDLDLRSTQVTASGVQRIAASLPDCQLNYDQPPDRRLRANLVGRHGSPGARAARNALAL